MINKDIHFLLVPDSNSRRAVQTRLVQGSACVGVVVGSWQELIHQLSVNYQYSRTVAVWHERLQEVMASMPDAFWADSYLVDPDATLGIVEENVIEVLSSKFFNDGEVQLPHTLQGRALKCFSDIEGLIEGLQNELPPSLTFMRYLMGTDIEPIRYTRIYIEEDYPVLTNAQIRFIELVNEKGNSPVFERYQECLKETACYVGSGNSTTLGHLQRNLFNSESRVSFDQNVNYLGVRDYLQETEVIAGIIQKSLNEDSTLSYADFGILAPTADHYYHAIKAVFGKYGIPISGLCSISYHRDVAQEMVLNFLECQQKPAPVMAMAAFLTSSLMPWDHLVGKGLADQLMAGRYDIKLSKSATQLDHNALSLMQGAFDTPTKLRKALASLVEVVSVSASTYQIDRLKLTVNLLEEVVSKSNDVNFRELSALIKPEQFREESIGEFHHEGISFFTETQEPWRSCKHLLVLGFNSGHYPSQAGFSPVFSVSDIADLRQSGLPLESRADCNKKYLDRFLRQLRSCTDSCTFLVPRLKPNSSKLYPSESLVYMHGLIAGVDESDNLILDLDKTGDLSQAGLVAIQDSLMPVETWAPSLSDLRFDSDLLDISKSGQLRPLSPSRIETLMVSPLAWLLSWFDLEPKLWEPDKPSVLTLGTLAHGVFEDLFKKNSELPTPQEITSNVEPLLEARLHKIAPFMLSTKWEIERLKLVKDIIKSALAWRDIVEALDARVIDNEIWLKGEYVGVPIRGQADSILQLKDGRLIVVDHKKAGVTNRKPRMEKGYDCQVTLYREMLKSGFPEPNEDLCVDNVEVLYYLMNGQRAISEKGLADYQGIPGWIAINNDVSIYAMELIRQRVKEIREGSIQLNKSTDEDFYIKKAGFTPYALSLSPLVTLFMKEVEEEAL